MRLKIRTKVFLIGALVTFALMSLAFLLSVKIYMAKAKDAYLTDVNSSVGNISTYISDDVMWNELMFIRDYVLGEYQADPTTCSSSNLDEKHEYFKDKYGGLYTTGGLGLSEDKLKRQSYYHSFSSQLMAAVSRINTKTAFLAYKDDDRGRYVYLVDYAYLLGDNYNAFTRFPGDYYQISESERASFGESNNGTSYDDFYLDGLTAKYADVYIGETYFCTVFAEYNVNTINEKINDFVVTEIIALSGAAVVMVAIFVLLSHFAFTKNIFKLNGSALKFSEAASSGKSLSVINPDVKSKDELGELSETFVALEKELIAYTERVSDEVREKERINAELSIASAIQAEELPADRFSDGRVKVLADYISAKEVGGDLYDYFYIGKNRFGVVIADVSGKGVPAALFMMKTKGLIRNKLIATGDVERTAYEVNNELMRNNRSGLFVTAFIGVVDLNTKIMQCVSAGHEKPYLIDGDVQKIDVDSNFILGGQKDFVYKKNEFDMAGKKLFLYTDGLNEAINGSFEEFGYDRIEKSLKVGGSLNVNIIEKVKSDLKEFVGENAAFDDLTVMLVDIGGGKIEMEFIEPDYGVIESITDAFNAEFSYVDKEILSLLDIVIDELINNFVSYEKSERLVVGFSATDKGGCIEMTFTGNGEEFNPLSVKEKYINAGEKATFGGFGITIAKKVSDKISYSRKDGKNIITVVKKIDGKLTV